MLKCKLLTFLTSLKRSIKIAETMNLNMALSKNTKSMGFNPKIGESTEAKNPPIKAPAKDPMPAIMPL